MAAGRPVITTDVPPLNELPLHQGGWTVDPNRADELADVVLAALNDSSDRVERGRKAAQLVSKQYSRAKIAEQYADLYHELLA